ncbi:hypothetical protein ACQKLN_30630 [Paenibacillus glucanolyticus]|uniref:hypothetical protein n=1 Tax=Paenibacillus glucanolyticus TaxID=59843 RepID=UPI0036B93B06
MSLVIHEQRKPQMQPFYWVITFEMHVLGLLLSLVLTMGPLILLYLWNHVWSWISLAAIPAGIFMGAKLFRSLKGQVWNNTHLDEYLLYEDHVEYERWDPESKDSFKGSLWLGDVKEIYYGRYIFSFSYAYKKSKMSETLPMAELMPVLYLVGTGEQGDRTVAIPFTDPMDANRWLGVIGRRDLPIYLTSIIVQDLADESVADVLREDEDLEQTAFDGNIERQYRPYLDRLLQESDEERELTEEELNQLEYEMKLYQYEEALQKRRSAFRGTGLLAWLVFPVQFGIAFWLTRAAEQGTVDPEQMLYPILLLGLFSILFFVLVKWMRWLQILIFPGVTFITFVFLDFSEVETDPSYQMSSMLLAMTMLSLPVVTLIYLGIRHMRKGRDIKNLPPIPEPCQPVSQTNDAGVRPENHLSTRT